MVYALEATKFNVRLPTNVTTLVAVIKYLECAITQTNQMEHLAMMEMHALNQTLVKMVYALEIIPFNVSLPISVTLQELVIQQMECVAIQSKQMEHLAMMEMDALNPILVKMVHALVATPSSVSLRTNVIILDHVIQGMELVAIQTKQMVPLAMMESLAQSMINAPMEYAREQATTVAEYYLLHLDPVCVELEEFNGINALVCMILLDP